MSALEALLAPDSGAHFCAHELTPEDSGVIALPSAAAYSGHFEQSGPSGCLMTFPLGLRVPEPRGEQLQKGRGVEARKIDGQKVLFLLVAQSSVPTAPNTAKVVGGGGGDMLLPSGEKMSMHSAHITPTYY